MIADNPEVWDAAPLNAVLAYKGGAKQAWDNTDLTGPWLNGMRIWGFKEPNFLCVSATHGAAHLALYDQDTWDKYQLAKLAGGNVTRAELVYGKKVRDGETVLTRIHHRQTPLLFDAAPRRGLKSRRRGMPASVRDSCCRLVAPAGSSVGPVAACTAFCVSPDSISPAPRPAVTWTSEAIFQEEIGNPIGHVDIPAEFNTLANYSAAMVADAPHPVAARAWLDFIGSDGAFKILEHYGFRRFAATPR